MVDRCVNLYKWIREFFFNMFEKKTLGDTCNFNVVFNYDVTLQNLNRILKQTCNILVDANRTTVTFFFFNRQMNQLLHSPHLKSSSLSHKFYIYILGPIRKTYWHNLLLTTCTCTCPVILCLKFLCISVDCISMWLGYLINLKEDL